MKSAVIALLFAASMPLPFAAAQVQQAPPAAQPAAQPPLVNRDAQLMLLFDKRVKDYVALHQKLEATLPPMPTGATPAHIDGHHRALMQLLQKARPRARHGDFFAGDIRGLFRRLIARSLSGADGRRIRAAIMADNPGPLKLEVNGRYPDAAPRSTMPTQLLQMLPKLPEELEYGFLGRRLVLIDVHAHVLLDFIDNALQN